MKKKVVGDSCGSSPAVVVKSEPVLADAEVMYTKRGFKEKQGNFGGYDARDNQGGASFRQRDDMRDDTSSDRRRGSRSWHERRCWNCGDFGHIAWNCPDNRRRDRDPDEKKLVKGAYHET